MLNQNYRIFRSSMQIIYHDNQGGFSVINLIATLAIAGIIGLVSVYDFKNLNETDLQDEVRNFELWFRDLRSKAIAENKSYLLKQISGTNFQISVSEVQDASFQTLSGADDFNDCESSTKVPKPDLEYNPKSPLVSARWVEMCLTPRGLMLFNIDSSNYTNRYVLFSWTENGIVEYLGLRISFYGTLKHLKQIDLEDKGVI